VLTIERAGGLTTIQDAGRRGHHAIGVSVGGAMDDLAFELANRLVGNRRGEAVIEIALCPVRVRFEQATTVALAGAPVQATIGNVELPSGWRSGVRQGELLRIDAIRSGMRVYLAVAGGIEVPTLLGSRSTDLKAGFGGLEGRRLRDGDRLAVGPSSVDHAATPRLGVGVPRWDHALRVLPGPELIQFTLASRAELWRGAWTLTPASDKMGLRLHGPALQRNVEASLPSHAVMPGVIQCPPSGQPIILAADAQTTGGYPRVGVVIRADLWKLAQWRPGTAARLVPVSVADALDAWRRRRRYLERIESGLDARGP
jgi:5-oxoprolinase (ATP-hydrolysing) subunit C